MDDLKPIEEFLAALASDAPAPGAGAAAGIAVALAAACAAKAASITLKHEHAPALQAHQAALNRLAAEALNDARRDGAAFVRLVRDCDIDAVEGVADALLGRIEAVLAAAEAMEPLVRPAVRGDLAAARELARAAQSIVLRNLEDDRSFAEGA